MASSIQSILNISPAVETHMKTHELNWDKLIDLTLYLMPQSIENKVR